MNDIQAHRGPDGSGIWRSEHGGCVLGHRRLSIIDLSPAGAQPMVHPRTGLAITYNGEIYNFVELRRRLEAAGHVFHSGSDTEVILNAYSEWGPGCLEQFNGMFAFALWDERNQELFCARDRFGEKPFYYALIDGVFAFASEVKALATLEGVSLEVDDGVLGAGLERGLTWFDADERTLVRGVRQLMPAETMTVRRSAGRVELGRPRRYWDVERGGRAAYGTVALPRAANELLGLLRDSVRLRLRSDVRVGSCLSGGLDSSAIVSLMRQLEPTAELRTFTGRFPGHPLDEGRYAALVVAASRTTHFETEPTPARFLDRVSDLYYHADFPIGGMSQFAQYCVFGLAREHGATVLLDGQGSDEQLGGYGNEITRSFLRQLFRERRLAAFLVERRASARVAPRMFSWPRLLGGASQLAPVTAALLRARRRGRRGVRSLLREEFLRVARPVMPPLPDAPGDDLSRTLWLLAFRTMLSGLLRYGDRLSMAHSREVRLPFCDHRIAEFAFGLPPELLVGDGQVKRVLRAAIEGLVPPAIVTRPKQGFVPPQTGWLIGDLASWVRGLVDDGGPLGNAIDLSAVKTLANAPTSQREADIAALWSVVNLLAWSKYSLSRWRRLEKRSPTEP